MSQVGVSRPPSQLKVGVSLPEIQHPMSRMSNPENLDVRGVSRGNVADAPGMGSGRPLASEGGGSGRVSRRLSRNSAGGGTGKNPYPAGGTINIDSIPEGVEVKYGDPGHTRLPVFGMYFFLPSSFFST